MTTPESPAILDRVRRSLARDSALPAAHRAVKALRFGAATALAPLYLLACDRVGPGARTRGRPLVSNAGWIQIGARANIGSMFAPTLFSTSPGGRIEIGDDVVINFGCTISAETHVALGDRVSLGPYVTIVDAGGPDDGARRAAPIRIGDDVWLAARARVHPGVVIGDGAVIAAGSEVTEDIPPGVVAAGAPAHVLRTKSEDDAPPEARGVTGSRAGRAATLDLDSDRGAESALRHAGVAAARGLSRLVLHGVDRVGARPSVHGRPFVENLGHIWIGDDFTLCSSPVRAHLVTGLGGVLRIGHGVSIGSGAGIAATERVEIGDGAHLGPAVLVIDSDYHDVRDKEAPGASAPILIGAHAWLGEGVVVLHGATVGAYARVEPGSVVLGRVPEGAVVAGVPARVVAQAARGGR